MNLDYLDLKLDSPTSQHSLHEEVANEMYQMTTNLGGTEGAQTSASRSVVRLGRPIITQCPSAVSAHSVDPSAANTCKTTYTSLSLNEQT